MEEHCYADRNQATIKALNFTQVNSKLVFECVERLNTFGSHNTVWMLLVSDHVGLAGNEVADKLARKGEGTSLHSTLL